MPTIISNSLRSPSLISSNSHTENLFGSRKFYYSLECYFVSKQFLTSRIKIAVFLHFVNLFVYIVPINIWLEIMPYNEMNSEGSEGNIRYRFSCNISICPPHCCLHLIVVRRFEYAGDPESYTSGSVATGRASLAGHVKG